MPKYAAIKIHSEGGIRVSDVVQVLTAIEEAYNALYVYETLLNSIRRGIDRSPFYQSGDRSIFYVSGRALPFLWETRFGHGSDWPPKSQALRTFVLSRDRLVLKSVELHSPGFWEVLGSLNPLETIRKAVGDAHERRKDREYREAAEKDRLALENRLLQTELWSKQLDLMERIGATENDFAAFRNALVIDPLMKLEHLQDRGLINGAEDTEDQFK